MRSVVVVVFAPCLVAGPACVGAPPPPPGQESETGSEATSAHDGTMEVTTTLGPLGTSTGPDGTTTTTGLDHGSTSGEPTSTTASEGEPLLSVSDGAAYDFGLVAIGLQAAHVFTVTNEGTGTAYGLTGRPLDPPFAYAGGFPGVAGTCGQELAAGDECSVELSFTPADPGLFAGVLAIGYDGHEDVVRDVTGGGSGQSGNLLANPGGEDAGSPPPGWVGVSGNWLAGVLMGEAPPHEGSFMLYSDTGPNNVDLSLRQDVPVDASGATFSFEGFARALTVGNDDHRIRVHYLDAAGVALDVWTTDYQSLGVWTPYSDVRTAPEGTRTIRVELNCRKASGTWCNAYFDALELYALYP